MSKFQIFISYRREGGEFLAGRLSDKLTLLGYHVFYDIESMRSGPFNEQIYSAIDECDDVLLILPPNGLERCMDEGDWVRKEIEYSIQKGKNIVPLMMPGFEFPSGLPESITSIANYEAVKVNSQYFDAVIDRIKSLLKTPSPETVKDDKEDELKNGLRFLNQKMYPQALKCFENVMQNNLSDPEAYFYSAVAMLGGKRPFLVTKPILNTIETYIESAIAYGEKAVYYYFYAYIKYDYYAKKMLKTSPTYQVLLDRSVALGITDSEKNALYELLNVVKPEVL